MPMILDNSVARIVGKIMSEAAAAPYFIRSAKTEDGITCTLVAFITKNIAIAYSVPLCFSSSLTAFMPIGVVAPLIPKIFAEILSET